MPPQVQLGIFPVKVFKSHPLMEDITLAGTDLAFSQSKWKRYRREKDTVKGCDAIAECGSTQDDELFWQVFGTINAQSIVVLISSPNLLITTATMEMLGNLITRCSPKFQLAFVKADLIPRLIPSLNPLSFSFTETVDIHTYLMTIITCSLWLVTPSGRASLEILGSSDGNKQQAVHETVLTKVLFPSEKYICHLCMNRFSIVDGDQSYSFLALLAQLLEICPYHQRILDIVLHIPVFLTIASCHTFFEYDDSISWFLSSMVLLLWEWNEQRGKVRKKGKKVLRMLRMEGIEDVMEENQQNDKSTSSGREIVTRSIKWNNFLDMNVPNLW
ncbi:hypothetical protein BLNAU_7528 [Blattamonas nauphoetae]|uniref:Uncharacterized protein n=1 Tax=Blattamonas nauphoetae TaxID=2049346 RepID=A0ABQ9Y1K3_9EUKA|nr:hypothetical protein BLNAU_7528 [Blattamonas nauphoetae]